MINFSFDACFEFSLMKIFHSLKSFIYVKFSCARERMASTEQREERIIAWYVKI